MASCEELQTIFTRIETRIRTGTAGYNALVKVMTARIEAEEKIGSMLKQIGLENNTEQSDPLVAMLAQDMIKEGEVKLKLSADLRKGVSDKLRQYGRTMEENERRYTALVKKDAATIRKACEDVEKARKDVEDHERKLSAAAINKQESQQNKVAKAKQQLDRQMQQANQTAVQIQQNSMPQLHAGFSTFDSGRVNVMQCAVKEYAKIAKESAQETDRNETALMERVDGYDGKGRSQRYVGRVFDTKNGSTELKEDETPIVVAIADYRSEAEGDLQFLRGDRITVLSQHSSGWWTGKIGDRMGMFPKTYVDFFKQEDAMNEPVGAVFLVIEDYSASKIGEIDLLVGDLAYVDFVNRGRCSGTNMRTKKRGYFPLSTLETGIEETQQRQPQEARAASPTQSTSHTAPEKKKDKKFSLKGMKNSMMNFIGADPPKKQTHR